MTGSSSTKVNSEMSYKFHINQPVQVDYGDGELLVGTIAVFTTAYEATKLAESLQAVEDCIYVYKVDELTAYPNVVEYLADENKTR